MRRLAQGLFGLAVDILTFIVVIIAGGIGAVVGFIVGLIIFGAVLSLEGWVLAVPALIVAGLGFVIGALFTWGYYASIDDVAGAVGRVLGEHQNNER
jgi:hypothetical protein